MFGAPITTGFRRALHEVRVEYRLLRKHRRGLKQAAGYRRALGLKLNLGCGRNIKPGWVNVDISRGADLTLDLREPLPFAGDSCSIIYSEHFLEHVDYPDQTIRLLRDCWRVLETGGIFSAGVPDTEWPLLEYAKVKNEGYFKEMKSKWHPAWCSTNLEHVNYHFRQDGEHRMAYDFETLECALGKAGFTNIQRRNFDPDLDSASRELGTLYVEAHKP